MNLDVDETLVEAARALGPIIREHAAEAERERQLPQPVLDAMAAAGMWRLYVPKSLGGLETDPVTCARVVEVVSGFDSIAGWAIMATNTCTWFCAQLPDAGAEELYAEGPDVFFAGALHPPMRATPTEGGYLITGRNPLASNCHAARWLQFFATVQDGDQPKSAAGAPEFIVLHVRAEECQILDTWHALGMRGSDSNDVALDDVFVPAARVCAVTPESWFGRHFGGPLYRAPAMGANVDPWAPLPLALARGAIDEVRTLAGRKTPFGSTTPLRERGSAQAKVGLAEALLSSARTYLYDRLHACWEQTLAGEPFSIEQKAELLLTAIHAMQTAAKVIEMIYTVAGSSAIYARSRLERHLRDILVLKQHGFISENRYATVGQVLLGLPPDVDMVAL